MILEGETVLPDDYPVFCGYFYVADGEPVMSYTEGTVAHLKRNIGATEIRRCELIKRERTYREALGRYAGNRREEDR